MSLFKYPINITTFKAISIIFLALLLSSCTSEQGRILQQADSVMETRPDSAMTLLDGIDRSKLNKAELPYFALLYAQAQVKTDVLLDSDSLISLAYAKYGNDFSSDRGLRSNFYTGEIFFNRQKNPEAMRYFLTVYEESKRIGNRYWQAKAAERISDLFFFAYNYDEAEKFAREAALLFKLVDRQTFHRYALAMLANLFLNNGKAVQAYNLLDSLQKLCLKEQPTDSAFLYYINIPLIDATIKIGNWHKTDTTDRAFIKKAYSDGRHIDATIIQAQINKAEGNGSFIKNTETATITNDNRLHLLYALYKNSEALGDTSLALSYVDSLLLLQSEIAENVIKESVTGAQRDFYSSRAFQEEERNSYLSYLVLTIVIAFIIVIALLSIILHQKHKAYKTKSDADLEAIMSLRSASGRLAQEKNDLQEALNRKGELIGTLIDRIEASRTKVEELTREIENKDSEHGQLQESFDKVKGEYTNLEKLLTQKNGEFEIIQTSLNDMIENESSQIEVIETLFRDKWTILDRLCAEYFSLNNSEISNKGLLESINKEVNRVTSKKGLQEIVTAVDTYMGGIITLLRDQCPFIKEADINYIALVYAGFTVKAVCMFLDLKYQHFFVKKSRLIQRIQKSDAPDKDLFISKLK